MSLKQRIEESPVIYFLGALVTGYLAGVGTYDAILRIAKLDTVRQGTYILKEDIDRDRVGLSETPIAPAPPRTIADSRAQEGEQIANHHEPTPDPAEFLLGATWRGQQNSNGSNAIAITFSCDSGKLRAKYVVDGNPSDGAHEATLQGGTVRFKDAAGNEFVLTHEGEMLQGHIYRGARVTAQLKDLKRDGGS